LKEEQEDEEEEGPNKEEKWRNGRGLLVVLPLCLSSL
jgi:hypothetical protein